MVAAVVLLLEVPSLARTGQPQEVALDANTAHYFREDSGNAASYLRLSGDGSYEVIDVQHMYRRRIDCGAWVADGSRLFLYSEWQLIDLVAPPFRVFVFSRQDADLLLQLKTKVLSVHADLNGRRLTVEDTEQLRVSREVNGQQSALTAYLDTEVEFGQRSVEPSTLLRLAAEIDSYWDELDTKNVFPYQCFSYRGHTFLVPLVPGADAVPDTAASVKLRVDKSGGAPPPYRYLLVSRRVFEEGITRNYPFRFVP